MTIFFEDYRAGTRHISDIESLRDTTSREGAERVRVQFRGEDLSDAIAILPHTARRLVRSPMQLIPSEPGLKVLHVAAADPLPKIYSEPMIAWALCADGQVRAVTPNGVLGISSDDDIYVEMPGGSVQVVGEWGDRCSFADANELLEFAVQQHRESGRPHFKERYVEWEAAESRVAEATLDLSVPQDESDLAAQIERYDQAVAALLALPARTPAQAIRKIELYVSTDSPASDPTQMPRLLAEAKQLAAA